MNDLHVVAWCRSCENIVYAGGDFDEADLDECEKCAETLTLWGDLAAGEKAVVKLHEWLREVKKQGLGGPSPGGACQQLGCSRSMVDKLVNLGHLERSEYDRDGHKVVMISSRSIERVKAAKADYGKWTETGGGT